MRELPEGWVECRLGEVVEYADAQKAEPENIPDNAWILELEDIEKDTSIVIQIRSCNARLVKSTKNRFFTGDVLYGKLRPYLNKVIIAQKNGYCSTEIIPITAPDGVDNRFLFYSFKRPEFIRYASENSHGVNMPRLGTEVAKQAPFPLPPLPEQHRIADKLDALTTRIDSCKTRLSRVPELVKRFRQTVLEMAVTGKLTEDWRVGKGVNLTDWKRVLLGTIMDRIDAGLNVSCIERPPHDNEKGLVKISAVTWGEYNENESKTFPTNFQVDEQDRIIPGDFLISRANTLELVGACVIVKQTLKSLYLSDKVLRISMPAKYKQWINFFMKSEDGRRQIEDYASGNQLSMRNISQAKLKEIILPLPGDIEIHEIVRRIESLFSLADRLERKHAAAVENVNAVTSAILTKAFQGTLVPQDPADEPAEKLLERIKKEKQEQHKPVKKRESIRHSG